MDAGDFVAMTITATAAANASRNTAAPGPDPLRVTVRRGDTLSGIAMKHGVSLAQLQAANPAVARQRFIFPGDVVVIPGSSAATTHVVRRGETLSGIGAAHGVSWQSIAAASGLRDPDRIFPGQRLVVPGGMAGPAGRPADRPVARPAAPTPADQPARQGGEIGARIAAIARQYEGRWARDLRADTSDALPMRPDIPVTVNCANFVSGVLREAGALPASGHQVSVVELSRTLGRAGWTRVPAGEAPRPGDVAIILGNGISHTEIVADSSRMIGSNGRHANGQRVGYDHISYATQNGGYFLRPPASLSTPSPGRPDATAPVAGAAASGLRGGVLHLTAQDVIDLKKTLATEWVQSAGDAQARGIIDTILNRHASGRWGSTIADVVNARSQFSDINGRPAWTHGRDSVDDLPMARISRRANDVVDAWLAARASGTPSSIGSHLNYANPNYSDKVNLGWIMALDGPVLGRGDAIHRHGTVPELDRHRPGAFSVTVR